MVFITFFIWPVSYVMTNIDLDPQNIFTRKKNWKGWEHALPYPLQFNEKTYSSLVS